ncbi:hypothetical protein D8I24_5684 [Cupriavidus necator H850]|uniref:hypothetical protein n=1 Tax=Cupriavidus necator TaxID=106590 RepID=UPI00129DEF9A|nr:hypothetical protein [Cupriavidus necator]KAI3598738.1 hypothetical protein D8I24_5684 [Cupriavidus necator H850]
MAEANSSNTPCNDVKELRATVNAIDALSHEGFSEIAAIAGLAMASLETPSGCLRMEDIAHALRAIRTKADDIANCINWEAEKVGCNHKDEAQMRRFDARIEADAVRRQPVALHAVSTH